MNVSNETILFILFANCNILENKSGLTFIWTVIADGCAIFDGKRYYCRIPLAGSHLSDLETFFKDFHNKL